MSAEPAWIGRWNLGAKIILVLLVVATAGTLIADRAPNASLLIVVAIGAVGMLDMLQRSAGTGVTTWLFWGVGMVGTCVVSWSDANGLALLFCVAPYAQFQIRPRRRATIVTVTFCVVAGLIAGANARWRTDETIVFTVLAAIGVTVLLNRGVEALVDESIRRGALIAELERTRSELGAAHHAAGEIAERERLAREIHDTLAQGFTSLLMLIQTARAQVDVDLDRAKQRLELAEATARENLAEARALVGALAPVDLADGALDAALRRIISRTEREMECPVSFDITGTPRAPQMDRQVVLVRAAQEALTNARRHADATAVQVSLGYHDAEVSLTVADNGRGFDPACADGYGLAGMRARVEQVGGRLALTSRPGHGTTVEVAVP